MVKRADKLSRELDASTKRETCMGFSLLSTLFSPPRSTPSPRVLSARFFRVLWNISFPIVHCRILEAILKFSPPIPISRKRCSGSPWLPSHLLPLSLDLSLHGLLLKVVRGPGQCSSRDVIVVSPKDMSNPSPSMYFCIIYNVYVLPNTHSKRVKKMRVTYYTVT